MTLEQFIEEQKRELESFFKYWLENNRDTPPFFPLEMNPGEWTEQLHFFVESKNMKDS